MSFMSMPPFIPDPRFNPQQPPVSEGFSSKGIKPESGSLRYRLQQRRYTGNHLGEHTPQLSRVSKQDYSELQREHANELLRNRVKNYLYQPLPNAAPSPAPSRFGNMFSKAREFASYWRQPQQQQQQQQQRPHTNDRQRTKMTREKALRIMGFRTGYNPYPNEVKKAFIRGALKYHPDKNIGDSIEVAAAKANKYKKIHKAYDVLTKSDADVDDTDYDTDDDGGMSKTGGNNTIKRRHKKHKLAKKTRSKKHSNRRSKTYRKTRKNTTKRR